MATNNLTLTVDDKEMKAALAKLEKIDRNKAVAKGLRRGSTPVYRREKQLVKPHKVEGGLIKSMTKNLRTSKQRIYVGFRRGKGLGNASHLVEQGTTYRFYKSKKGRSHFTGAVRRGHPSSGWNFASTAFREQGGKALEILISTVKQEIRRITGN